MTPPCYVVAPVKNQLHITRQFVAQLQACNGWDFCFVFENGSTDDTWEYLNDVYKDDRRIIPYWRPDSTVNQMWNDGRNLSRIVSRDEPHNVAILNNDIIFGPELITSMAEALRCDDEIWATYPDYLNANAPEQITYTKGTFKDHGLSGWAFLIKGEANIPFIDEQFIFWAGDQMIEEEIQRAGKKVGRVNGLRCEHIDGGSQSWRGNEELQKIAWEDVERFRGKYGKF